MFAAMRTGSNFLEANLNCLPGVTCHGEAFNPHFIGTKDQTTLFGIDLAARAADPLELLARLRQRTDGLAGFRFFHDHDPRVFDAVMADPACAKIILVSWFSRAPGVKGAAVRPDPGGQRRRSDRILLGRSGP